MEGQIRAQSAIEFLTTYSWAILIIFAAMGTIYFFINTLFVATPSQCFFSIAVPCSSLMLTSNSANSIYMVYFVNAQSYSIKNPTLFINSTGYGTAVGKCGPNYVLPGGTVICNATARSYTIGSVLSGFMLYNQSVCTQIATSSCGVSLKQRFNGTFTTHTSAYTPIPVCAIVLAAATATPSVGVPDLLTATVTMGGAVTSSATVNFTTASSGVAFTPPYALTNINGTAVTYVTGSSAGSVTVTAKFLNGCTSSKSLTFS